MKEKLKRTKLILMALSMSSLIITGCKESEENLTKLEVKIETEKEQDSKVNDSTTIANATIVVYNENEVKEPEVETKDIVISAVGDCTLGTDINFGYDRSFTNVFDANNKDFKYFFAGVYEILSRDSLSIANLETTFTDSNEGYRIAKQFNFKGDPSYTNILTEGSIEAVNLANNHTYDYGTKGYNDTLSNLEMAEIPYFGYENYQILDVEGIKIGLAGITGWNEEAAKNNTQIAIDYFHENNTDLIIISYHWGIEREYKQNAIQESIGRYAIDCGADLVLGHHPHVLQGIENYKGKYIVYSLGNFVFGGNRNPSDKDTMIFQQTFHYENGVLINTSINIIPCSLSSRADLNDYQPNVLEGEEADLVLKKVLDSSTNLDY